MKRKYYINTRVAGVQYNEAIFCVEELKNGKKLKLVREEDNKFDPNAIAIYFNFFISFSFNVFDTAKVHEI